MKNKKDEPECKVDIPMVLKPIGKQVMRINSSALSQPHPDVRLNGRMSEPQLVKYNVEEISTTLGLKMISFDIVYIK